MADPFVDVMGPLRVLRERIEVTFAERGLRAVHVAFLPGTTTEGPHEVQILATLADGPPPAVDEEFVRMVRDARDAEIDERAGQALRDLEQRMGSEGGFLD